MNRTLEELTLRYPALLCCRESISASVDLLLASYRAGGKVLVCGNGGSAADAEHICGELLKKFKRHRAVPDGIAAKLRPELVAKLEGSLPAISLVSMSGIVTAFANDVSWETAFAQQVLGLAKPEDVLIALSTSGNSADCVAAAEVMKAVGGESPLPLQARRSRGFPKSATSRFAFLKPRHTRCRSCTCLFTMRFARSSRRSCFKGRRKREEG